MPTPSYLVTPQVQRIPGLLKELLLGHVQIPRFQRPFVWSDDQRLELLSSIYRGIPIGSVMVWRTATHRLATYDRLGPFKLAAAQAGDQAGNRQYLLDGHQRLSTLYGALIEGLAATLDDAPPSILDPVPDADSAEVSWPIYFDLEDETFCVSRRGSSPPDTWLPLAHVLDPFQLFEFQNQLRPRRDLLNRAEHLASVFKDYSVPVVPIVTEDMDLVTTGFQRINSAGTGMSEVHMVRALTWESAFDLDEEISQIQDAISKEGWRSLDPQMILNVIKASLELDVYKASPEQIKSALQSASATILQVTRDCLQMAVQFLAKRCRVHGPLTLPYSFQLVVLADFMRLHGSDLSDATLEALVRWFWRTTYTEYFAGMNSTTLRRAMEHVDRLAADPQTPLPEVSETVGALTRFDYRAARSRAWSLRLADLEPRQVSGEPLDAHRLLGALGNEAVFQLVPSRYGKGLGFGTAPENRLIALPREGRALAKALRERPFELSEAVRSSHGINDAVSQALAGGDYRRALALRRGLLCEREGRFAQSMGIPYV